MDDLTYPNDLGDGPQGGFSSVETDGTSGGTPPEEEADAGAARDPESSTGVPLASAEPETQRPDAAGQSGSGQEPQEDDIDDLSEDEGKIYGLLGDQQIPEEPPPRIGRDAYYARRILKIGGDKIDIQGDLNYNTGATEEACFETVSPQLLRQLSSVFVRPPRFGHVLNAILRTGKGQEQSRVVLVHGPDHSGKWTCAVNLALQIRARDETPRNILQYSRPLDSELTLREALGSLQSQGDGQGFIILLKDCFERRVRREELEPAQVQVLGELLLESNSLLVLTGDVSGAQLESLTVRKLPAQVSDLRQVLDTNLRCHINHFGLPLTDSQLDTISSADVWRDLQHALATPFHIHQFCSRLGALTQDIEDDSTLKLRVVRLAREIAIGGREASRAWFDDLHENEKLLALMVYTFPGAERWWLEALEHEVVERFRASGFKWFSDPRELGLVDARSRIHAIEQGGRLEFDDRSYAEEARRQVENRQHLLWDAMEPLLALEPQDEWVEPWKRQALGVALGRLGLYDVDRLLAGLEDMASSSSMRKAVVPGYAFQELVRQEPVIGGQHALRTLRAWIRSADHRLMWAAGAALWRVYFAGQDTDEEEQMQAIKLQALALVRLLGENLGAFRTPVPKRAPRSTSDDERQEESTGTSEQRRRIWQANFRCVGDAMRRIALADPERACVELRKWFSGSDPGLVGLGRMTVRLVHETLALQKLKPTEEQSVAFLRLVPSLFHVASEESRDVETVFLVLRGWLRWKSLRGLIHGELLYLATFAEKGLRVKLRSIVTRLWLDPEPAAALRLAQKVIRSNTRGSTRSGAQALREAEKLTAYFCEGTEGEACGIAQAVIARCLAMDGRLPTLPCMGKAVAVFDPELLLSRPASDEASASAVWTLLSALESRLDLAMLPLGATEPAQLFDGSHSIADSIPRFPGHRLVVPGLEKVPPTHSRKVYVVAPQEPHDFLDLAGHRDLDSLHFIGPLDGSGQDGSTQPDGVTYLKLSWPPTPPELEATLSALEIEWARGLVSAPADHLRELTRAFDMESVDSSTDMAQLEELAREVDHPRASSDPHYDPVWRIVAYTIWFAATDLPDCVGWIRGWLVNEEKKRTAAAKRAIALAAASALISLYTAYPPDPSGIGRAPTLLFDGLAEPLARRGSDGVEAILRLVRHWLEDSLWAAHLAGDVSEGRGRLERWALAYLEDRSGLLGELAERLDLCRAAGGIDQSWEALRAVVERVRALKALSQPQTLPRIEVGQRYALLVLDTSTTDGESRKRLVTIAAQVYRALATRLHPSEEPTEFHPPGRLVPALFRLGETRPFWTSSEVSLPPDGVLATEMRPPCLIGPLLEALKEKRQQIAAVLLISSSVPLDLEDWRLSSWWNALTIYSEGAPLSAPGFKVLPKPMPLTEISDEKDEAPSQAATIAAHLEHTLIDGLTGADSPPADASGASS